MKTVNKFLMSILCLVVFSGAAFSLVNTTIVADDTVYAAGDTIGLTIKITPSGATSHTIYGMQLYMPLDLLRIDAAKSTYADNFIVGGVWGNWEKSDYVGFANINADSQRFEYEKLTKSGRGISLEAGTTQDVYRLNLFVKPAPLGDLQFAFEPFLYRILDDSWREIQGPKDPIIIKIVDRINSVVPASGERAQQLNVVITVPPTLTLPLSGLGVSFYGGNTGAINVSNVSRTAADSLSCTLVISGNAELGKVWDIKLTSGSTTIAVAHDIFEVTQASQTPYIISLSPSDAPAGSVLTILGNYFGSVPNLVMFGATAVGNNPGEILSWTDTVITLRVPDYVKAGVYDVKVVRPQVGTSGIFSNPMNFEVLASSSDTKTYPNPFNPTGGQSAHIRVNLDADATVGVYIYDIAGKLVWKNISALTAGQSEIIWSGMSDFGEVVMDGVYLARVVKEGDKSLISKGKILVVHK